jgi:phospholipid/cholesterol/gamma-HCH transport system permease protein
MAASLALEGEAGQWRLRLSGDWSLGSLEQIEADLTSLPDSLEGILECDWSGARSPGIGPSWALLVRVASIGAERLTVRHTGPPQHLEFLEKLRQNPANGAGAPAPRAGVLGRLGRWALEQGGEVPEAVAFFGRIVTVIGEGFSRPRALRISSLTRHVYETGVTAIPIVASIAFLISVIVAYLGSQQLARFGADIFVVDLVAIAVLREMGVLLTAIIVAGRSGSAFAAEIGAMRLNEETDALRAMGMNPIEMLVVPRVLALAIALPLLTILADAMGLAGGGLLSMLKLHISWPQFMNRAREALAPTTFWAGLIKAPVFAVLIGMVGTYRGMQVRESARELGRLTTVAVVQSIFLVILADAFFAVLFVQLDF